MTEHQPLSPDLVNAIVRNPDDPRYPSRITVFCDHCGTENTGEYMVSAEMTSRERLDVARRHLVANAGWEHTADGDDFCPDHAGSPAEKQLGPGLSERRDRYAAVIRDRIKARTFPPGAGSAALFGATEFDIADAAIAVADAEQAELRRERDLAIAHDRQPYPTAWAYEQACAALHRKTDAIERVRQLCADPVHGFTVARADVLAALDGSQEPSGEPS